MNKSSVVNVVSLAKQPVHTIKFKTPKYLNVNEYIRSEKVPTQYDFELYIERLDKEKLTEANRIKYYINYKLHTTNSMIKNIFTIFSRPTTIFTKKDYSIDTNDIITVDLLLTMIDALNEDLDSTIISKNLNLIACYFEVTPNLINKLNINIDNFYYICYMTCTLDLHSHLFTSIKHNMRELARTSTVLRFTKYIKEKNLTPDNYCYEFYSLYNNKLAPVFKNRYVPTINSIIHMKRSKHDDVVHQLKIVAETMQTMQYMESDCIKI